MIRLLLHYDAHHLHRTQLMFGISFQFIKRSVVKIIDADLNKKTPIAKRIT